MNLEHAILYSKFIVWLKTGMMGGSTHQQIAAAMQAQQTQNLLAILQAQQLSSMNSGGLLPNPSGVSQRGRVWILLCCSIPICSFCFCQSYFVNC